MIIKTSKEVHERFRKELIENVPNELISNLMKTIDNFNIKIARKG